MIVSFEGDRLPEGLCAADSVISLSRKHKKDGESSLCWQLTDGGSLELACDVGYRRFVPGGKDQNRDNFVVWIYLEKPLEQALEISFWKAGRRCCWFSFGMGFCGWRTCWVPYEDMEGNAEEGMDRICFSLEGRGEACLYLDQLITAVPIDPRHPVRDVQVPFVNPGADRAANAHWTSLYRFWGLLEEGISNAGGCGEAKEAALIEERFEEYLLSHRSWPSAGNLMLTEDEFRDCVKAFDRFRLQEDDGVLSGVTIDAACQKAAYPEEERAELTRLTASIDIKEVSALMLDTAYAWHAGTGEHKRVLGRHVILLLRHLFDQGWAAGSSLGTTHHLGYPMRSLYAALFLMRRCLKEAGLKEEAAAMMAWYSGSGRMFREREELRWESMDTLNTLLQGILASVLMMEDGAEKHRCLSALSNWLSSSLKPAPGLKGPFKEDGSVFHHCGHYPAYAMGGFMGAAPVIWFLSGTSYCLREKAHETMRRCLLTMRLYCNRYNWLVSMSSRHPKGEGEMSQISNLEPFYYMALAGTPDKREAVDSEMAGALLRLAEYVEFPPARKLKDMGYEAEKDPNGHTTMNYACAAIHRRDHWLAGVRGHSRYLWGNETYVRNNLFGRYITYGHLQLLCSGTPVNNKDSGFSHDGWDWNCFPGTTAPALPWEELRAKVRVVDQTAGAEEMLLSDQAFAGGVSLDGWQGAFAMKLHGHAKYDGSLRANKSWFFFDNRIVCLGTDIEDGNEAATVRTTLFQHGIKEGGGQAFVNGRPVSSISPEPYISGQAGELWLKDPSGNLYYLPEGQSVTVTNSMQESRAQDTGEPTFGTFAKAWIDHGHAPAGGAYEYLVLVQPDDREWQDAAASYRVLQADCRLHEAKDEIGGIIAYAFFENGAAAQGGGVLLETDSPCLIMERETKKGLSFSLCDPDLRLYEGVEPDQFNPDQSQREVSLYSRTWRDAEGKSKKVSVLLKGGWKLDCPEEGQRDHVRLETADGNTRIVVDCIHGRTTQLLLSKV